VCLVSFMSCVLLRLVDSVEECLVMCGLRSHADAIVGSLDVEQWKHTMIRVELAVRLTERMI